MAKKKQAKQAERKESEPEEPLVDVDTDYMAVQLGGELYGEPETVRRLAHRVADFLVDSGRHARLADSVECHLTYFADDVVVENVNQLIREARAPGKEVGHAGE